LTESEPLKKQLGFFIQDRDNDFEELISRWDQWKGELEDVHDCFENILAPVENTNAEKHLLSILQHFLLIPDDFSTR
jgi:hypothetical protein